MHSLVPLDLAADILTRQLGSMDEHLAVNVPLFAHSDYIMAIRLNVPACPAGLQ